MPEEIFFQLYTWYWPEVSVYIAQKLIRIKGLKDYDRQAEDLSFDLFNRINDRNLLTLLDEEDVIKKVLYEEADKVINNFRKRFQRKVRVDPSKIQNMESPEVDTCTSMAELQENKIIHRAYLKLKNRDYEILRLIDEGFSYPEIRQSLGISAGVLKSSVYRIRQFRKNSIPIK
jgi:hypothetical protein